MSLGGSPRARWVILALALLAGTAGCRRLQAPPVELSFRDSLVGAGKIIQVANTSNEALAGLEVKISTPSGESRTFTLDELAAYQEIEIGWKKLGGWQVPPGAEIEIRADGHLMPFKGRLPESRDGE